MTDPAFEELGAALRRLGTRLAIPLPTRTRLLHELKYDVEGFTTRLVARGMPLEEARLRASETLIPDESALSELERLSTSRYRRATADLTPSVLRLAERSALAVATAGALGGAAAGLLRAGLLTDASPFLWPVLTLGGLLGATVLAKVFELWVKRAHDRPRRGVGTIAALSATIFWVGCTGVLVDLVRLSTALEREPEGAGRRLTEWLVRDAALLATAIIVALAGALGWFVVSSWITHVEHAHQQAMALADHEQDPRQPPTTENRP